MVRKKSEVTNFSVLVRNWWCSFRVYYNNAFPSKVHDLRGTQIRETFKICRQKKDFWYLILMWPWLLSRSDLKIIITVHINSNETQPLTSKGVVKSSILLVWPRYYNDDCSSSRSKVTDGTATETLQRHTNMTKILSVTWDWNQIWDHHQPTCFWSWQRQILPIGLP